MRIAIVSNSSFSLINFRKELMFELINKGHEIFAFAPDFDKETKQFLNKNGITAVPYKISRSSINPYTEVSTILELRRKFTDLDINLSLAYFLKPVIYSAIASHFSGVGRNISLIEGLGFSFTNDNVFNIKRSVSQICLRFLLKISGHLSRAIIVLNEQDLTDLKMLKITSEEKLHLLGPIGVDIDSWSIDKRFPQRPTFIMAARLIKEKGVKEFLEAAKYVKSRNSDVRFILLGSIDDHPSQIKRTYIEGFVEAGIIEWPGHVDVKPWLADSSVFVLPTFYREGVPRSIQEAMVVGLPVITSDIPGCRETVVHNETGYLIPPQDKNALIEAMLKFCNDPEKIRSMGRAGRSFALEHFDIDRQNEKLINILLAEE